MDDPKDTLSTEPVDAPAEDAAAETTDGQPPEAADAEAAPEPEPLPWPCKDTICEDTLTIIREYYQLNLEPLFSAISEDCVWLSIGNLLITGASAIRTQLTVGFEMPPFDLTEPDFRTIDTGSDDQLVVLGTYYLHVAEEEELICVRKQRLTFCYRKEKKGYRLYHMHVSNEDSELVGDEVFPAQVSKQTYDYVQHLLRTKEMRSGDRIPVKAHSGTSYIDAARIQCIRTTERTSILHMGDERRTVRISIKELEKVLPDYFYRVHRCYFINCHYVTNIKRYTATLLTGEEIPVPKWRYMEARADIRAIIERDKSAADDE
ncbi:MAG: LytTR family DNA-binding domain-containing protein [Peptococcaceae bacterium]|nr:LytTR family DNA-binding domain-containing protein [Peptococcaceae bacterium]